MSKWRLRRLSDRKRRVVLVHTDLGDLDGPPLVFTTCLAFGGRVIYNHTDLNGSFWPDEDRERSDARVLARYDLDFSSAREVRRS
jgi:hypothetical protein